MEEQSKCPYCGAELRDGAIPVGRDNIFWCPRGENGMIRSEVGEERLLLGTAGLFSNLYTPARYCKDCRMVFVPVPEIETFVDKAGRWLSKRRGKAAERREEEKVGQKSEEKQKKDPWEVE